MMVALTKFLNSNPITADSQELKQAQNKVQRKTKNKDKDRSKDKGKGKGKSGGKDKTGIARFLGDA